MGRYFDAVSALVFARTLARYEGQAAMVLNGAADPLETGAYRFELDRSRKPWCLDLRPAVREIVEQIIAREDPSRVAARFHNTLVAGTAAMARAAIAEHGRLPVVLSGGCFQNPLLAEGVAAALSGLVPVHQHRAVPPGDGGIALGQAMIARVLESEAAQKARSAN